MSKSSKVAISLPREVLSAVDKERAVSGENRSELFRRAVEMLLQQRKEKEMIQQYVRGYQEFPETEEETAAAMSAAADILAEEPWE